MTLNWTDKITGDQLSAVEINNIAGEVISHSDLFSTKVSLSASQQAIQALIDLRATQVSLGNLDTRVANLEGVTDDDSAFATQVSLGHVKVSLGALDSRVVSIENNGTSSYSDNDVASYLVSLGTSIIPDTNASYDLGSAEKKIRHLYLSANSMYLGDENQTDPNDMLQVSKAWLEGRASSESLNNLDAGMQAQFSGLNQDLFDTSVDLSNTKADVDSIFGRTDDILATTPIDIKGATEGDYQGTATMTVASGFSFTSQFAGAGIVTTAERFYVIKGDTNGVVLSANSTTYTISRTLEYGYYVWTFGDNNGYSLLSNYVILLVAEDGVNLSSYDINDIHLYDAAFGGFINSSDQSYNNTTDTVDSNSNPITYTGFESTSTYFSSAISGTNVTSLANYSSPFSSNVSSVDILGAPTFSSDQINIQISLRGVLSGEIGYVNIKKVSGGSTATDYLGVSIPFEIETGTIDGASILNIYVDDSDPHTTLEYIQNKAKYLSHNTTPQATATNFGFFLSTEIQQPQLLQIDYTDNNTAYTTNSFSYFDLSSDISIEAEAASTITGLSQRVSTLEGITDDDSAYANKVSLGQLDTRVSGLETLSDYSIATLPASYNDGGQALVSDGADTGVALAYHYDRAWYRSFDNVVLADSKWSPADTTTELWYDASDLDSLVVSGTDLTQWSDKSGNGYHLTKDQNASSNTQSGTASLRGRNVIEFGAGDSMTNLDWSHVQNTTAIYAIFVSQAYIDAAQDFLLHHTPTTGTRMSLRRTTTDQYQWLASNTDGSSVSSTGLLGCPEGEDTITILKINGSNSSIHKYNQTGSDGKTGVNFGTSNLEHISIGSNESELSNLVGYFAEVIYFTDSADVEKLEGYLAHKWGLSAYLPSDHTYKALAP